MNRFRRWQYAVMALLLMAMMSAAPTFARGRLPGRNVEQPGDEPVLDSTGDPEQGGGGRAAPRGELLDILRIAKLIWEVQWFSSSTMPRANANHVRVPRHPLAEGDHHE